MRCHFQISSDTAYSMEKRLFLPSVTTRPHLDTSDLVSSFLTPFIDCKTRHSFLNIELTIKHFSYSNSDQSCYIQV